MAGLSAADREKVGLFVDEMRAQREQRGWSREELARRVNYSVSLIAMVETYQRGPTLALATALDRALETPGFREASGDDPGAPGTFMRLWRRLRNISFPESFRPYAEHEEKATELRTFEHSLVPGLLQTDDYARGILTKQPSATDDKVAEFLAARLARQAALTRKSPAPPLMWAVLDEGVLHREVSGPEVMYNQLKSLVIAAGLPNVTIQVLPYSIRGHSGLLGAFIIADFATEPSIVFLDDLVGGRVAEDTPTVTEASLHFSALRSEALPKTASRELIAKVAEERWKR
jgi:transcriptional regulator with XRE-family HTH domain